MGNTFSPPMHPDELPLAGILDRVRASEERIATHVQARRTALQAHTGLTGRPLDDALAVELVEQAAEDSALITGGMALPFTVPPLGPLSSAVLAASASTLWVLAREIELCYALAFAYQVAIPRTKLEIISYWLVHLTNYDDLRSLALARGVRLTVRKLVEKLIAVGLTRAIAVTAPRTAVGMLGRATPWYIQATGLLGVPVVAVLSWRGTQDVGERAIAYFKEELARERPTPAALR